MDGCRLEVHDLLLELLTCLTKKRLHCLQLLRPLEDHRHTAVILELTFPRSAREEFVVGADRENAIEPPRPCFDRERRTVVREDGEEHRHLQGVWLKHEGVPCIVFSSGFDPPCGSQCSS